MPPSALARSNHFSGNSGTAVDEFVQLILIKDSQNGRNGMEEKCISIMNKLAIKVNITLDMLVGGFYYLDASVFKVFCLIFLISQTQTQSWRLETTRGKELRK